MKTIWKFKLSEESRQELTMPIGAEILCVQWQEYSACIWALVDPPIEDAVFDPSTREMRKFELVFTGDYPHPNSQYIGTIQKPQSYLVYHVFELKP